MDAVKTKSTLEAFNKYIVQQSKSNLTRKDRNVSKKLYDSIKGEVKIMPRSFEYALSMEQYGEYLDKGVKGRFSSAKAPNSPFKFGSGTGRKGGLTDGILNWVTKRRLQFKDRETGKFLSYEQTARTITRSIYNTGTKPTEFYSRPFELAFKRLPGDLITAYGLDVETFLKYSIKNGITS
jgi:hypothetical protein